MYYKITNQNELHGGIQYKTGVVKDPKFFDSNINSGANGIFFSDENILAYSCHGIWVRKINIPVDAIMVSGYPNGSTLREYKANKLCFGKKMPLWNAATLLHLNRIGVNVHVWDSAFFRAAIRKGYLDIVKCYIEKIGGVSNHAIEYGIFDAEYNKKIEIYNYLKNLPQKL